MGHWFNRIVLLVALAIGIAGGLTLRDGVSQYVNVSRTFADVTIDYKPGSFAWTTPDGSSAHFVLVAVNDSSRDAVVESLDVHLYFESDFAGSNYSGFQALALPAGATREIGVDVLITSQSKLGEAGSTALRLGGTATFRFEGIQRARGMDVLGTIGIVPLPSGLAGGRP